jgi:hypothetical protein
MYYYVAGYRVTLALRTDELLLAVFDAGIVIDKTDLFLGFIMKRMLQDCDVYVHHH